MRHMDLKEKKSKEKHTLGLHQNIQQLYINRQSYILCAVPVIVEHDYVIL